MYMQYNNIIIKNHMSVRFDKTSHTGIVIPIKVQVLHMPS